MNIEESIRQRKIEKMLIYLIYKGIDLKSVKDVCLKCFEGEYNQTDKQSQEIFCFNCGHVKTSGLLFY